uniref:Uncharacterized protein n=1 Tax=Anguilla anguilla TaxID=7936 RepID=A0A0E9UL41_ANGAN
MMQKVRVLVSAFFLLVWVVSFLFQLSLAVLFLLRYKFCPFLSPILRGEECFILCWGVFCYTWLAILFYYG